MSDPQHVRVCQFENEDGGDVIVFRKALESEGATRLNPTVDAAEANKEVSLDVDVSDLVSVYIRSDQDVTIYTNEASTGAPDETIELKADVPLDWQTDSPFTLPLLTDLTALFLTNAGTEQATVQIRLLFDTTP